MDTLSVKRDALTALVARARHDIERHDVVLGNSTTPRIEWACRDDCPVCLMQKVLATTYEGNVHG